MSQINITRERAFEILKIDEGIGFDAIKHAYRKQLMKWHPKRHNHSSKSIHMFLEIREAFKFLVDGIEEDNDEIWSAVSGGNSSIFGMKSDSGYFFVVCNDGGKLLRGEVSDSSDDEMTLDQKTEKANKAAADLINEENEEKRKADKRREKKQRQKMRKKQAKQVTENKTGTVPDEINSFQEYGETTSNRHFQDIKISNKHRAKLKKQTMQESSETESESEDEEPSWDKDSAFFTKVAQNSKVNKKVQPNMPPKTTTKESSSSSSVRPSTPTNVIESRKFALQGNEYAAANDYSSAIELFTKAIFLHNRECKYFGNRAYCYERIKIFGSALEDANTAIALNPDWVKGHFRRGKALMGLKQYAEAEQSFEKVLKIDKTNKEAEEALREIQLTQLMNMGFEKELCAVALKKRGTVQLALDELLSGVLNKASLQDVYISDEEDAAFFEDEAIEEAETSPRTNGSDQYSEVDYNSLWVGNITQDITRDEMEEYFCQFGELKNINLLYQSRCAFVNYVDAEAAKLALLAGDTIDVGETTLLIRYPDRAFNRTRMNQIKECHYWRNHGCQYGSRCHYAHIPEHRGIDIFGSNSGMN